MPLCLKWKINKCISDCMLSFFQYGNRVLMVASPGAG